MNDIYYELAIIINNNLYQKNYITYKEYIKAENKIIKEITKNGIRIHKR